MNNELVAQFESLLRSTGRDGIENLIDFIRKSDFYTAPASSRFHNCHEGGLLEHTMNVYHCLLNKKENPVFKDALPEDSSLIIIALLHDLCKVYMYTVDYKNKKVYSEHGAKSDSNGRFDWVTVPGYTVEDVMPLGHGEKSVILASKYIDLTPLETYAILYHMGFTIPKDNWNTLSAALRKYPIILAIHEADLEATYMLEEDE